MSVVSVDFRKRRFEETHRTASVAQIAADAAKLILGSLFIFAFAFAAAVLILSLGR